jgi:hypothetical protein
LISQNGIETIRCRSLWFWNHIQPSLGKQKPRPFIIGVLRPRRHIHAVPRMGIVLIYLVHERFPRNTKPGAHKKEPLPAEETLAGKLQYTSPAGRIATYVGDARMMEMC